MEGFDMVQPSNPKGDTFQQTSRFNLSPHHERLRRTLTSSCRARRSPSEPRAVSLPADEVLPRYSRLPKPLTFQPARDYFRHQG